MEETKKMKCYKRLIYKQFVQVSGLYGSVHPCILIMLYWTISVLKYQSISLAALYVKSAWSLHFIPIHFLISLSPVIVFEFPITRTFFNFSRVGCIYSQVARGMWWEGRKIPITPCSNRARYARKRLRTSQNLHSCWLRERKRSTWTQ